MKDVIEQTGAKVDVFKTPFYDSTSGQLILCYLAGAYVQDIEHIFALNRSEVYWKIALSNADVVLVDRLDLDAEVFAKLRNNEAKFYGSRPRIFMQIVLDVDEDVAYDRLMRRPITSQIYYNRNNLKMAREHFYKHMNTERYGKHHLVLDSSKPFSDRKLRAISALIV